MKVECLVAFLFALYVSQSVSACTIEIPGGKVTYSNTINRDGGLVRLFPVPKASDGKDVSYMPVYYSLGWNKTKQDDYISQVPVDVRSYVLLDQPPFYIKYGVAHYGFIDTYHAFVENASGGIFITGDKNLKAAVEELADCLMEEK